MTDRPHRHTVDTNHETPGLTVDTHRGHPLDTQVTGHRGHGQVGLYTHRPPVTPDHDPTEKPSWSVDEPDFNDILAIVARPRPDWMADALCKEHPEINFFPARGEPVEPAKAICARCLVRPECAAYGIEHNERGIWGGLSGQDRRRLRSASAQPGPGPSRPGRAS